MTEPNGNHGEKDKHGREQRARKQLRSRVMSCEGGGREACWHSYRVHLCCRGQGRTLDSSSIGTVSCRLSSAKVSQGEEAS